MTPFSPRPEDLCPVKQCPVCGSPSRDLIADDLTDLNHGNVGGHWSLWRCVECTACYLNPRLADHALRAAYHEYETHHTTDVEQARSGLGRRIRDGYLWLRYGDTAGRSHAAAGPLMYLVPPPLRLEWDVFARHLPKPSRGRNRLLDVGCGNGDFLLRAKRSGWSATGIDFDSAAVDVARRRGLDVQLGTIGDLSPFARFDAITLSHVIEHAPDPVGLLRQLWTRLEPGGLLWMITPNIDGPGFRRHGRYWTTLDVPRHLVMFNPSSLTTAIRRATGQSPAWRSRGWHLAYIDAQSTNLARGWQRLESWQENIGGPLRKARWLILECLAIASHRYADEIVTVVRKP